MENQGYFLFTCLDISMQYLYFDPLHSGVRTEVDPVPYSTKQNSSFYRFLPVFKEG